MTTYLKISIDSLEDNIKSVLSELEIAFNHFEIDYYLIGAQAIALWFKIKNIESRMTMDVDFAISITNNAKYDELVEYLISNNKFKRVEDIPHRLIYEPTELIIDLLPFGEIENNGNVTFDKNRGDTISVVGLKEVSSKAINIITDKHSEIQVASLAGICILKLIAWNENTERTKDIEDLSIIINQYFELNDEDIFINHSDLFGDDFNTIKSGARVLGRDMQSILNDSIVIKDLIQQILKKEILKEEKSKLLRGLIIHENDSLENSIDIVNELLVGLTEVFV